MNLNDVREAIVDTLKADAGLASMKGDIRTHRGRFTVDDLKAVAMKSLSILVSFLAVKNAEHGSGSITCRCVWGAFLVVVDKPQLPRDMATLIILSRLLRIIPGNSWGIELTAPERIEATNLYNGKMDDKGVVISAVTWEQDVDLDLLETEDISSLDDFLKFVADYVLQPSDDGDSDAKDNIALPGPEEDSTE